MTDEKIYELFEQREDKICDRFEGSLRTLTEFIAVENQGIKKSIDDLGKKVDIQNGSVRELKEWKAGVVGGKEAIKELVGTEHNKTIRYVAIASICVSFIAVGATIFNSCATGRVKDDVDTIDLKLFWKQDRLPDSTTRAYHPTAEEDSIYYLNLEKSLNK